MLFCPIEICSYVILSYKTCSYVILSYKHVLMLFCLINMFLCYYVL